MTRHEEFAKITGIDEPVEIEAVKMLLARISDDINDNCYFHNEPIYLTLYKEYVKWLNEDVNKGE